MNTACVLSHSDAPRASTLTSWQAALRNHEKPLQMTGSLQTNTQRRPQNISQTLVSFGLHSEFAGSFGKHLVDGSGGGDPNSALGPSRARTLQPYSSTPLETFRCLKAQRSPGQNCHRWPGQRMKPAGPGSHVSNWTAVWIHCGKRNDAGWN